MAEFNGTFDNFTKYVGPYLRNVVQKDSKKFKDKVGKCEICGTKSGLEAAHKHGKKRVLLIRKAIGNKIMD